MDRIKSQGLYDIRSQPGTFSENALGAIDYEKRIRTLFVEKG